MRAVRWIAGILVAIVLVLMAAIAVEDYRNRPDPHELVLLIQKSSQYHVRIRRDRFGVPHIKGARDVDVAFGLGFAHSEDDFATIQDTALATRGHLAATAGLSAAPTDYIIHLLRVWETVNAGYSSLPADLRGVLEAYADGVNYYAALNPSKVKPDLLPLNGKDIAAGFVFKMPFFYGLDNVLRKLTANTRGKKGPEVGSNGAAVAPSRSSDGATRLLVNSHQPYAGPVAWYEAELESGEGWHVAGGFFPGAPFMLHGHNEHLGWASTVDSPDLVDVYRLTINPADPDQYLLDGKWKNFEKSDAALTVSLLGPLTWTVHRDVLFSAHGPVLKTDHGVFAIRYAGMGEMAEALQYYRLDKARNLDEWKAAMRLQGIPSINFIYADEKGNIGYVYNGLFPVRKPGFDWKHILPGDRSDLIWNSYLPFDKIPQIWNPKSGFVFNSNNTPFQATAPEDDLKPADFSPTLGIQTNMTNRAMRALENFGQDKAISAETFRRYKFDLYYSAHADVARMIAEVCAVNPGNDSNLRAAQKLLAGWDRKTDRHNRATALAVFMGVRAAPEEPGEPWKERPLEALRQSMADLKQHFGRFDPEWGTVNRIRRGNLDLPIDGGPDVYRAVYGQEQADGTLTGVGGDTLIMFVTWDKNRKLSADSIHQFGSATLDKSSRHYADQTPLFAAMKTKRAWFGDAELKGNIEEDYAPGHRHDASLQ
jgi:acyl-homoserine-lactone acylase